MDAIDGGRRNGITGIIDLSPRSGEAIDLTGHVHHLPCVVKFTGPTSVCNYFKPTTTGVEVDGLVMEEAFFRGRKLQGTTIDLPEGYSGFVLGKKEKDPRQDKATKVSSSGKSSIMSGSGERTDRWEMLAKCRKLTVWNNECLPSRDDAFLRSFQWFAVSKALHESVPAEDLASMLIAQGQDSQL